MKQRGHRASQSISVLISLCVLAALTLFSYTSFYQGIQYRASDFKERKCFHREDAGDDVVIIALDNHSLKAFSDKYNYNWPWPRQFYGIALDYLNAAGADVVVYDILFDEKEIPRIDIDRDASEAFFADSLKKYGKAVTGSTLTMENLPGNKKGLEKSTLVFEGAENLPGKTFHSISAPIDSILNHSHTGIVTFHNDSDGVCRRLPLIFKADGKYYPQLAFAAYLEATSDHIVKYDASRHTIITEKSYFRIDDQGFKRIVWYGPGGTSVNRPYRYYSFFDVFISGTQLMAGLPPKIPKQAFRNKKVVVCATASGLMDLKPTPFTPMAPYPGGEIHATLLDNLLQGHAVTVIPGGWIKCFTLILLVLLCNVFIRRSLVVSLGVMAALCGLIIGTSFYLFLAYRIDMAYLFPIIAVFFASACISMYRMLSEGTARKQIRTIFSRYLHDDVIDLLMEDPDRIDLKGTELVGTVLFTDLQGFTTFAEDKTPQVLIDVLNRYFQVITDIVLDHGGMLDKYTGDGIMAVFGAPIENADHAKAACEVILAFRDQNVNQLISSEKGDILTRIGISSGSIVVGNLGSDRRMDFTAIGDTVNLSARLEGVNKAYGTTNMMSEFTWEFVKNDYFFRELDYIRVKGKNRPIRVFNLIARLDEINDNARLIEEKFEAAIQIYRERNWEKAIGAFEQVLAVNPDDSPAVAYIDRCRLLMTNPDLIDAQGVFTFKTK